jgi:hypothetical protein
MLYQIGLVLILIVIALIISKRLKNKNDSNDQLIYEDDMTEDELQKLDDEID